MFKKKKIVLTSVLALAGVSLATVGFATWVVGLDKKDDTLHVQAVVDNSTNKSVFLDASIKAENLIIAEKTAYSKIGENDIVKTEASSADNDGDVAITVNENALKFTFETLQYFVGEGATAPTQMIIELVAQDGDAKNTLTTADCLIDGAIYREKKDGYTYLKLYQEIDLTTKTTNDSTTKPKTQTYTIYNVTEKVYSFEWGTFFGNAAQKTIDGDANMSPVKFYNTKANTRTETGNELRRKLFDDSENINNELRTMKTNLTGKLSVKVSLK